MQRFKSVETKRKEASFARGVCGGRPVPDSAVPAPAARGGLSAHRGHSPGHTCWDPPSRAQLVAGNKHGGEEPLETPSPFSRSDEGRGSESMPF